MNREDIIKLAEEAHIIFDDGFDCDVVSIKELERFYTLATAPLQEQIAAQQARIKELVEAIKGQADQTGWYDVENDFLEWEVYLTHCAKTALSRTDDLSALNEAKAKVLEEAAEELNSYLEQKKLLRIAQELRNQK